MRLIITCGPAYEPLDRMRRLTNASTGHLGSVLADTFVAAGHEVLLFRGSGATAPLPRSAVELFAFDTNDDLVRSLEALSPRRNIDAVFHAAALCDFKVAAVYGANGGDLRSAKISSREGRIHLELEPASKVLPRLRDLFPDARIAGWKFEANGTRADSLAAAARQLREARTDLCVLNGPAWGDGFALCSTPGGVIPLADAAALASELASWLKQGAGDQGKQAQTASRG
jgi:phosphopantothenoylcysteine synthetase/decarboxylase